MLLLHVLYLVFSLPVCTVQVLPPLQQCTLNKQKNSIYGTAGKMKEEASDVREAEEFNYLSTCEYSLAACTQRTFEWTDNLDLPASIGEPLSPQQTAFMSTILLHIILVFSLTTYTIKLRWKISKQIQSILRFEILIRESSTWVPLTVCQRVATSKRIPLPQAIVQKQFTFLLQQEELLRAVREP